MTPPLALLLVEDQPDDAELVLRELRNDGFNPVYRRVCTAADLEQALTTERWDLICSDFHMPDFDAPLALAVRMRLAPDTPFIVVSGYIGETAAVELMKAGADDYVSKDNLARLAPAVRRELREAEQRRARRRAEAERERLVEELGRALQVRDDFMSIASHELRTPLTALRFNLHSIERAAEQGEVQRVHDKVAAGARQIERLDQLVADLMSVSDIKPGQIDLLREPVDLAMLLTEVVADFVREQSRPLDISTRLPDELGGRWDPARLREALRRLLSNALKFGDGKPIEVVAERGDHEAIITVKDHGIGIAAEDQEQIFDRFGRAVPVKNYGGFGLGLWIARKIVEAHGGTLSVASTPDHGSVFVMRLPLDA